MKRTKLPIAQFQNWGSTPVVIHTPHPVSSPPIIFCILSTEFWKTWWKWVVIDTFYWKNDRRTFLAKRWCFMEYKSYLSTTMTSHYQILFLSTTLSRMALCWDSSSSATVCSMILYGTNRIHSVFSSRIEIPMARSFTSTCSGSTTKREQISVYEEMNLNHCYKTAWFSEHVFLPSFLVALRQWDFSSYLISK